MVRIQQTKEKMGTKRSVLTDEKGLPLAVVLSGANTHNVKLLEETLDHIVTLHPEPDEEHPPGRRLYRQSATGTKRPPHAVMDEIIIHYSVRRRFF